ncbi:DUF2336 domain-containing protein [uncultured Cohaesibacter sp.]|uniref:DUF2336 domain-containing protein n=1 Tax=uncultured Cohaesibacter sp. TaxID=1002546 RepID=UPI0029310D60|nr:DUF2336 domain-containing protein [uncultured Cohaesibacter sp.]
MIDTISDLAREKSSDKRRELLGRVADLFFDGAEHHTEQESLIFRDIVMKMLNEVELEGRAEFSNRAATQTSVPNDVAMKLAQDDVQVAGPMLQHSPVLTDEDFVTLSQTLPNSHLEKIAQRESLSGVVTDALIENGGRSVWHKVSQNKGAEITEKGFETLVSNASGDDILQNNLCSRPDITEQAARKLLPLLPDEGKKRLSQLFEKNAELAGALVDGAKRKVAAESLLGRNGRIETKLLISDVKEGKADLSESLIRLVEADRGGDIVLFLAAIAELNEPVVSNALYQANGEPITILCKSIGTSSAAFAKLMALRCEKLNLSLAEAGRAVAHFKDLDVTSSQRAMRFVQMRNNLGPKKAS